MGFLTDLLGTAAAPRLRNGKAAPPADEIAAATAALERLRQQRADVEAQIVAAAGRRRDLLLADADDEAFRKLDLDVDRLHVKVEKLDMIEPDLVARLTAARDEAKRERWRELVARHDQAAREYFESFDEMLKRTDALREVYEQAAGFGERLSRMIRPPHPNIIDASVLAHLQRDYDRALGMPVPPISPQPPRVPPRPAVKAKPMVELSGRPPAPRPRRKPIADPAPADGQRAIVVISPLVELADGRKVGTGDRVTLPTESAVTLVRSGAAEFVEALR